MLLYKQLDTSVEYKQLYAWVNCGKILALWFLLNLYMAHCTRYIPMNCTGCDLIAVKKAFVLAFNSSMHR